jgi:hypothetical protein
MSVPAVILVILGSLIGLQIWTGTAIVGRRFRSEWLNNPEPEHLVHRDVFPQLYWLSIGIQSAAIASLCGCWWMR